MPGETGPPHPESPHPESPHPESPHPDLPLPDFGSLKRGRFAYFPVVPGRVEFAMEVRAAILRDRPQVIALELPATLRTAWPKASVLEVSAPR